MPFPAVQVAWFSNFSCLDAKCYKPSDRAMLLANWRLWVLPQLVNFRLVPPALRLPFGSLVALVWGVIQSIIVNR